MRAGELWRAVTALCLHADLAHLTANALFGSFFLAAAGRSLGAGLALALVTLAGAGGNAVNAVAHLFGLLVGVLLGLATALAIARPPGPLAQAGWGAAAVLLLLGSWQLAL